MRNINLARDLHETQVGIERQSSWFSRKVLGMATGGRLQLASTTSWHPRLPARVRLGIPFLVPLALWVWMVSDGAFYGALKGPYLSWWFHRVEAIGQGSELAIGTIDSRWRSLLLMGVLGAAVLVGLWHYAWGWIRPGVQPSSRTLLVVTAWVALWMTLILRTNSIVEWGRHERLRWKAPQLVHFMDRLDQVWEPVCQGQQPLSESEHPSHFNAYPIDKPTMCFFLNESVLGETGLVARAIERTPGKALRVELGGSNGGYWLERRYDHQTPASFVGGLGEKWNLIRFHSIHPDLYLVQYQ